MLDLSLVRPGTSNTNAHTHTNKFLHMGTEFNLGEKGRKRIDKTCLKYSANNGIIGFWVHLAMLFYIPVISQKRTEPKQTNKSINVTENENWYNA